MPKIQEDKQQITELLIDSADALKTYWHAPINSVEEATAKSKMKSMISDWIDWVESSR